MGRAQNWLLRYESLHITCGSQHWIWLSAVGYCVDLVLCYGQQPGTRFESDPT
jgi:hypothetical protein